MAAGSDNGGGVVLGLVAGAVLVSVLVFLVGGFQGRAEVAPPPDASGSGGGSLWSKLFGAIAAATGSLAGST